MTDSSVDAPSVKTSEAALRAQGTTGRIGRGDAYYVYTAEDGDAISVAANGIGPNGGWVGISIANMALPDKNKTREQINDAAAMFAAAPDLFDALADMLAGWRYIRQHHGDLYGVGWDRAEQKAEVALRKASAQPRGLSAGDLARGEAPSPSQSTPLPGLNEGEK